MKNFEHAASALDPQLQFELDTFKEQTKVAVQLAGVWLSDIAHLHDISAEKFDWAVLSREATVEIQHCVTALQIYCN